MYLSDLKGPGLNSHWADGAPCGLLSVQTFKKHVMMYVLMLHRDYSVFNEAWNAPCSNYSKVWRGRVESWMCIGFGHNQVI